MKTRILALFLSLAMLFTCMPLSAYAEEDRTRDAVIAALAEEFGSEKAEQIFNTMFDMGIIDENGNRIIYKIEMDGREYTLEQMKEIINSPDVDLSKEVRVDDNVVTLDMINDIIRYEEFLDYIDRYFINNDVEITDEHLASLSSLENQMRTSGIDIRAFSSEAVAYANGYRHDVYIKATVSDTTEGRVDFELYDESGKLTEALDYDISFDYKTLDGSAKAGMQYTSETGSITFEKNQTPAVKSINITISDKTVNNHADKRWNGEKTFFIYCYDIRNASFEFGNRTSCVACSLSKAYDYDDYKDDNLYDYWGWINTLHLENKTTNLTCSMSDAVKYAFEDGMIGGLKAVMSYEYTVTDTSLVYFYSYYTNYFYVKSAQGDDIIGSEDEFSKGTINYNQSTYVKFGNAEFATKFNEEQMAALREGGTPMLSTYIDKVMLPLMGDLDFSAGSHNGVFFSDISDRTRDVYAAANKKETVKPEVYGITAPEGTFISGDTIPVTVEFSEPVLITDDIKLTVKNGILTGSSTAELTPVDGEIDTISKYVTFLYTVPARPALRIYATAVSGAEDIAENVQTEYELTDLTEESALDSILELDNANSITGIELSPVSTLPKEKVDITVNLYSGSGSNDQNAWLTSFLNDDDGDKKSTQKLYASIDGGTTKIPLYYTGDDTTKLTGSFTAPDNITQSSKNYQVELYMDIGKTTPKFVPIIGKKADLTVEKVVIADPDDIVFNYPNPNRSLYLGETVTLGYTYNGDATYQSSDDFTWSSSDENVAQITATGTINPVGLGTVCFTLTNTNGGAATITKTTDEYTVMPGLIPKLSSSTFVANWKEAVQISWSSNITYKNQNDVIPAVDTYYDISLYREYHDNVDNLPEPIRTYQSEPNAYTFDIEAGLLTESSADAATPAYTVKITTVFEGVEYSALGYIMVSMPPATVALARPQNYSVLDTQGGMTVRWNIDNIDESNGCSFIAEVVRNGVSIATSNNINGSISVNFDDVTDRLKDIYTVKAQVKNSGDDTWSYDSYILNVYDAQALKIFVDGQNQTSVTMSNRNYIKELSSADIVALNRNIFLRNTLGINYNEYEYGAISDQIEWKSNDNSIASINYERGGEYRNIEEYSQTSYMPDTVFILAGRNDGTTVISATHKFTQLKRELGVTVETLSNRLYLFQFMPRAQTTVTYKKSDGQTVTAVSDENGALAIYEENGIQSDVNLRSEVSGQVYLGTVYNYNLVSGERNGARNELYPINNFVLRKAAVVDMYFKLPNGSAYSGNITVNGGVYKNGKYCETASISEVRTPDNTGFIRMEFDITKFWSAEAGETSADEVEADDKLQYIFELTFGDSYEPMLIKTSGNLSDDELVEFGESTITLRPTTNETRNKPVLCSQTLNRFKSSGRVDELLYETGNIGLTAQTPIADIDTTILWWGKPLTDTRGYVKLYNENGTEISGQTYRTHKYPFGTMLVTDNKLPLSDSNIWVDKKGKGKVTTKLYDNAGTMIKSVNMPYTVRNLLNVRNVTTEPEVAAGFQADLKTFMSSTSLTGDDSDDFVGPGLDFLDSISFGTDNCALMIAATKDPTVFNGIIRIYAGDDLMGGPTEDGFSLSVASDEDCNNYKQMKSNAGPKTLEVTQLLAGKKGGEFKYQIGGYFAVRIMYNSEKEKWEIAPIGGGIRAGLGASYNWKKNAAVGPVPVTAELEVGAAVRVDFDTHMLYEPLMVDEEYYEWTDESKKYVNDYLTNLRIYAYLYAFGGIGFDFSIVALKIGVFGQVEFESNNKFLNRPYLADASKRKLEGQSIELRGQTGIKFLAKFLFIEYQKTLASIGFSRTWTYNNWDAIEDYWEATTGDMVIPLNFDLAAQMYADSIGADMMEINSAPKIEGRSYLREYDRVWNSEPSGKKSAIDGLELLSIGLENKALSTLQSNAYPYSNPLVSDDGEMFVYLSDNNSESVWDTRTSYAKKNAGLYEDEGAIDSADGFGDSAVSFDGNKSFAAAAWVRQCDKVEKDAGDEINDADIAIMMNGTEIYTSVYNGTNWVTEKLTENNSPDLAPQVATNGSKAIVAWRSVYANDASIPTEFQGKDTVLYRIYDGTSWKPVKTLYNGISGAVMGISVDMLPDGTSLVSYVIDTANNNNITDYEIVCAIVNPEGEIISNIRLTNDTYLDENPQITTVNFGDSSDYRFILGWHRQDEDGSDIRLAVINSNGDLTTDMADSLKTVTASGKNAVGSNFRFAKGAQTVDDLSILWTERNIDDNNDSIKAIKFIKGDNSVYTSAVIDVATMPEKTLVDHFDTYISDRENFEVKAVILGTEYKDENEIIIDEDNNEIPVPKSECKLFTATERYRNQAEITNVDYNIEEIKCGFTMPIAFTVENKGFEIIDKVEINCDDTYEFDGLNLYPGASRILIVYYNVPENIVDINYSGKAFFKSGARADMTGDEIRLAVPDLGIGQIATVKEEDGLREFNIPLYNLSDYRLTNSGKEVSLAVYTDNAQTDSGMVVSVEITDNDKLEMIDNGAYIEKVTFNLKEYLNNAEIPDNGVTLFVKAVVKDGNKEVEEFNDDNNNAQIICENLRLRNNGNQFKIDVEQINDTVTTAKLGLQNLNMAETHNGNVAVNLLDKNGSIIETQYLSNTAEELVNLGSEGKTQKIFTFNSRGADVESYYFTANADDMNSDLQTMALSGTGLVFDKDILDYTLTSEQKNTNLTAISANPNAAVKINANDAVLKEAVGGESCTLSLEEGANVFAVTVTPNGEGAVAKTYTLTVNYTRNTDGKVTLSAPTDWVNSNDARVTINGEGLTNFVPIGFEYKINDGDWIRNDTYTGGEATVVKLNKDGIYTVNARLYNEDGYCLDADGITVKVDKTAPTLSNRDTDVKKANGNYVITATVTDNLSGINSVTAKDDIGNEYVMTLTEKNVYRTEAPVFYGILTVTATDNALNSAEAETKLRKPESDAGDGGGGISNITTGVVLWTNPFTDVSENDWFYDSVRFVNENGLFAGVSSKEFAPNDTMTRGMLVTVLHRLAGKPQASASKFTDAPAGAWFADAVAWASENSIVNGIGNNKFAPNRAITREEMAVIMYNYAKSKGLDVSGKGDLTKFTDGNKVSAWAADAMSWAISVGLISGRGNGRLDPGGKATRAENAAIIQRFAAYVGPAAK